MKRFLWVLMLLVMVPSAVAAGASDPVPRDRKLIIGKVSSNAKKQFPRLEALAQYLAPRLKDQGIVKGEAIIAASNREMISLLREGKVDFVTETPLSALLFEQEAKAHIFLREWKKGVAAYHTLFFTAKNSPIHTLADLRDKVVVFQDPGSTSGFLLPLAALRKAGLATVELAALGGRPPPGKVGYLFSRGEASSLAWVANGEADAGAFSNLDWKGFGETHAPLREMTHVFFEGPSFIRSLLIAGPKTGQDLRSAVEKMLLTMHTDEKGTEALAAYFGVKRFDKIEGAVSADLDHAREVYTLLKDRMDQ